MTAKVTENKLEFFTDNPKDKKLVRKYHKYFKDRFREDIKKWKIGECSLFCNQTNIVALYKSECFFVSDINSFFNYDICLEKIQAAGEDVFQNEVMNQIFAAFEAYLNNVSIHMPLRKVGVLSGLEYESNNRFQPEGRAGEIISKIRDANKFYITGKERIKTFFAYIYPDCPEAVLYGNGEIFIKDDENGIHFFCVKKNADGYEFLSECSMNDWNEALQIYKFILSDDFRPAVNVYENILKQRKISKCSLWSEHKVWYKGHPLSDFPSVYPLYKEYGIDGISSVLEDIFVKADKAVAEREIEKEKEEIKEKERIAAYIETHIKGMEIYRNIYRFICANKYPCQQVCADDVVGELCGLWRSCFSHFSHIPAVKMYKDIPKETVLNCIQELVSCRILSVFPSGVLKANSKTKWILKKTSAGLDEILEKKVMTDDDAEVLLEFIMKNSVSEIIPERVYKKFAETVRCYSFLKLYHDAVVIILSNTDVPLPSATKNGFINDVLSEIVSNRMNNGNIPYSSEYIPERKKFQRIIADALRFYIENADISSEERVNAFFALNQEQSILRNDGCIKKT